MRQHVELPAKERFYILTRDNYTCQYCGRSAPDVTLHVDHVHPVALGGTNDRLNVLTSCDACNLSKSDTPLPETLIRDLKAGIQEREKEMAVYKATLPTDNEKGKCVPEHLMARPSEVLTTYKNTIVEPLKDRAINPNKRHALRFTINADDGLYADYCRFSYGERGWHEQPVKIHHTQRYFPEIWRPLNMPEINELLDDLSFQITEHIEEYGHAVTIYRNALNVFYIQTINTLTLSVSHYCFWVPVKAIELAIVIDNSDFKDEMGEEIFWQDHYTDDED